MKKNIILAGLLTASTMMAADVNYFVGAGFERAKADTKVSTLGFTFSDTIKDTALQLRAGVILDDQHRISFSHAGYSKDGTDIDLNMISYDYLVKLSLEKTSLLVGGHIGSAKFDEDTNTFSDSSIAYGIHTGLMYDITDNISVDLTIAYTKLNLEDTFVDAGVTVKGEIEDSTSMGIGINYKF